jgi:2-methylcitrate dehydratase PrpD
MTARARTLRLPGPRRLHKDVRDAIDVSARLASAVSVRNRRLIAGLYRDIAAAIAGPTLDEKRYKKALSAAYRQGLISRYLLGLSK